jgi:aromatic ring-cleaving dioxygenase
MQLNIFYIIFAIAVATAADGFSLGTQYFWNKLQTRRQVRLFRAFSLKVGNNDDLGYTLKERNPYDVHVYYNTTEEKEQAFRLLEKMRSEFSSWMRFYEPKGRPIGPHPVPMLEVDFGAYENRHRLQEICEFLEKERGDLSILIHPHSTDSDYMDHTKHAIWFGEKLELRFRYWAR